jgi:hypothetical protein
MPKTNKNMKLWESVETTDPAFTTRVNQRGGFTAIGAQYQLRTATETFGPFGTGWGVKNESIEKWEDVGLAVYTATLWYLPREFKNGVPVIVTVPSEFPINSSIKYHSNGRVDDDFMKKVATDALTKGLSKLGFNADVFMGKFDDNKYVNKLTDMSGTWKKEVVDAMDGLSDEDTLAINGYLEDGSINFKNYKKALTRITDLKSAYVTNGS